MDRMNMQTPNLADGNFATLAALFPNAVTETITGNDEDGNPIIERAIDADVLAQEINTRVVSGKEERYQFTWPDKNKSVLLANTPITAALRPCREESVDFDTTENLYIEGDNLDVLKLLRETYLNRVKMIYIDPPYNTGKDFIYEDDFSEESGEFLRRDKQYDEQGNRLTPNLDSNGRFHTDWLNMIYPRLRIAQDLLAEDGVIFISIDDNEVHNTRKVCDEVFGSKNFVNLISVKTKSIAGASGGGEDKRLKKNIEYVLIYAKNYVAFTPFTGAYTYTPMIELVEQYRTEGKSWHYTSVLVDEGTKEYFGSTTDGDGNEIKLFHRHNAVVKSINQIMREESLSEKEVYYKYGHMIFEAKDAQSSIRQRIINARKQFNIDDDIISIEYVPKTGKNKGKIYEQFYKGDSCRLFAWLRDISETVDGVLCKRDLQGSFWDFTSSMNNLTKEGGVPFPNGKKPLEMLTRLARMQTDRDSIILDFFSGSATTAHAVMDLNTEDGGKRKFIMVQLPEVTDEKSEAHKAGYKNICEIGKERIRRAGKKIKEDNKDKEGIGDLDIGFRVLKLDSSNMKDVYYTPEDYAKMSFDIEGFMDNIKPDRSDDDLLFQVMLDLGIPLSSKIKQDDKIFYINDNYLIACFGEVNTDLITEIAKKKPYYAVFRDSSFLSDSDLVNFEQIFNTYSPNTIRRVL